MRQAPLSVILLGLTLVIPLGNLAQADQQAAAQAEQRGGCRRDCLCRVMDCQSAYSVPARIRIYKHS